MERQLDPKVLTEDLYGNNAAVTCPVTSCGKVYIVSRFANGKKGRKCPKCGQSETIVNKKDGRMMATISWTEAESKPKGGRMIRFAEKEED